LEAAVGSYGEYGDEVEVFMFIATLIGFVGKVVLSNVMVIVLATVF